MRFVSAANILVAFLLASCSGGGSDPAATSALEKQLVGHWSTRGDDHLYFGETDPSSKIGSYILIHPDGKTFAHRYEVESANPGKQTIKARLLFASGASREETFVIAEDGKSLESATTDEGVQINTQLERVDDETAP